MLRCSLMRARIFSPASKKYFSMPMFGAGRGDASRHHVGARRPHEVAAEGVDVVRELDVRERVHDPLLVLDLRLGVLARAVVDVAGAARRRAEVAVERRVLAVVAVEVDAPGVAGGRVADAEGRGAVVGHVAALGGEVVHRVVAAIRVDVRHDEDLDLVHQLLGVGVRRVVLDEPLGGLDAAQAGGPLASVLLAVEEHADLGAVPNGADAVHALLERAARHVRRRVEEVVQVDLGPRLHGGGPGVVAEGRGRDERRGCGVGVDRRDDLGRRAGGRAGRVGRQVDEDVLAGHGHGQRSVVGARVADLGGDLVAALVAPVLGREDDRAGRRLGGRDRDGLDLEREVAEVTAGSRRPRTCTCRSWAGSGW